MENSDRSFQKPFDSLPVSATGGNSNYPADSGMLVGTEQNRKGNLDLSKSTGYLQEEASLRVSAEKAYAALQSAGLSPQAIQNIMENSVNSIQKLFESAGVDYDSLSNILKRTEQKQAEFQPLPEKNRDSLKGGKTQPAAEEAYAALRSAGLSPRAIQNLLGNNGHSFQKILDFPASTSGNNSLSHSAFSRMPEKAGFQLNDPQNQWKRNEYSLGQERGLKLSLDPLEKGMEESLANLEKEGILGNEESWIQSRNSARGKAAAVLHFDVDLNSRQESLLEKLPEFNSRTTVPKDSVNMTDLSALTAKTGVEFAMFTKGNQRLIVRGNTIKTPVYLEEAKQLAREGYRWSGHTHPGTTSNCLVSSKGDMGILRCFPQKRSIIYNSVGMFSEFEKE